MKRQAVIVSVVLFFLAALGAGIQPASAEQVFISIGTGGTGGTYFPTGGAVADLITRECPSVKSATAEVTAASVENAKLVNSGDTDMGMVAWISIVGDKLTDKLPNLRTLWWIHGSDRQWYVFTGYAWQPATAHKRDPPSFFEKIHKFVTS